MKKIDKGHRKTHMLNQSIWAVGIISVLYMIACAFVGVAPDAVVMAFALGALGGGHATANYANAHEHKSLASKNETRQQ